MRTNYVGHDLAYQQRRAEGAIGWDDAKDLAEHVATIEHLFAIGSIRRGGKLLELGCGAGNVSLHLASEGFEVQGVDIAPSAIAWARDRAVAARLVAEFHVGDVLDLAPFADAEFDVVVDGHCLHCIIGDDRARFFASARRVLKPGGWLTIHTMCGDPTNDIVRDQFDPDSRCLVRDGIARRYLGTVEDIEREVGAGGFRIAHSEVVVPSESDDQPMLLLLVAR